MQMQYKYCCKYVIVNEINAKAESVESVERAEKREIKMIKYMILKEEEIDRKLFCGFIRHQVVDQCLRRENNKWVVRSDPFVDDWTEEDYQTLIGCLRNTAHTDGFVYGAFLNDVLKGFVSVERGFFGGENLYYDLSSLHVSEDMRRKGIGKELFLAAAEWARKQGAKKLYLSSHSAVESQAFYHSMGCVDAAEYNQKHVEEEPYDRQLEYVL